MPQAMADHNRQEMIDLYRKNGMPGLKRVNPAFAGWITVPHTKINYPVLQAQNANPNYYLTHDYKGNKTKYGSIFANSRTPIANSHSRDIILYGHAMKDGRMFRELAKFKQFSFYQENPVFTFNTGKGNSQWKVISAFLANTIPSQGIPFDYLKTRFKNDSQFLNFVYQLRIRSLYHTPVDVRADDQIVLLSTCSYEFDEFRMVVVGRRVRAGENPSVDVSRATANTKAVYPDIWYRKYGGTKPVWPATYEEAKRQNILPWT